MQQTDLGRLPALLWLPDGDDAAVGSRPVICFLHGYDEGAPSEIERALTLHGPCSDGSSAARCAEFIVIAPQLPTRGDLWFRYADAVLELVERVQAFHNGDPDRTYLTGFSFGGNGVFDLAQEGLWAALWPVDPPRVPEQDSGLPIWLSSGELSRRRNEDFVERLGLQSFDEDLHSDRVILDYGLDHVGTARAAYQDDRIYRWLLCKQKSTI
ncbi:hypothetical protein BH23GEM6_BH23GEM6_19330 [soil metagenome]